MSNKTMIRTMFLGLLLIFAGLSTIETAEARERPPEDKNNVWYEYNDTDTVFVFVHGILSDSRNAWYYEGKSPEESTFWPELVVTGKFDNASVFLGGFYTEKLGGEYSIRDAAKELLQYMTVSIDPADKSVLSKQNIVFIAHSLGGIAVRHLLTREKDVFRDKNVGLVLVASPSIGSEYADRFDYLIYLAKSEMGKELKWKNSMLTNLDKDFRELVDKQNNKRLVGMEAIENHSYKKSWWPSQWMPVVVSEESGGRYFGVPTRIGNSDHSSIAKPEGVDSVMHIALRNFYEQQFLPMVHRNSPEPERDLVHACSLKDVRVLGWKSGDKTDYCIEKGYPQGHFNHGDDKNGGICMSGEATVCQAYATGAVPENVSCGEFDDDIVSCFHRVRPD